MWAQPPRTWTATREELTAVYAALREGQAPNVSWGTMDDGAVVIVQVADDYCVVCLGAVDTFYYLMGSDDDELVDIVMGGGDSLVPKYALVPRELGLEVLLRADEDFPGMRTDYPWIEQ